eukprot:3094939-Rhodomonas_salina.3
MARRAKLLSTLREREQDVLIEVDGAQSKAAIHAEGERARRKAAIHAEAVVRDIRYRHRLWYYAKSDTLIENGARDPGRKLPRAPTVPGTQVYGPPRPPTPSGTVPAGTANVRRHCRRCGQVDIEAGACGQARPLHQVPNGTVT